MNTCPRDYDKVIVGNNIGCRKKCPQDFKYVQTTEGGRIEERCVYMQDNRYSVKLYSLPGIPERNPPPHHLEGMYSNAEREFQQEFIRVAMMAARENADRDAVTNLNKSREQQGVDYRRARSEFATYRSAEDVINKMKSVNNSLQPLRPPTVTSDSAMERRKLMLETSAPNMLLFQISLVILLLCLLSYVFLTPPASYYLSFLLLTVGIALGIFLRK
jgi:hypothetical protein